VLYASTQAHHCVEKAANLAGILPDRCRRIPTTSHMRIDVAALSQAIARDKRSGLVPFMVVSSAGTTNTGAIDDLHAVADVCKEHDLWHHADGAYGAFFHMCDELRPRLAGLSRCHSLTLDPHKGLFLPYGTGALLVRDGEALKRAHDVTAGYLPPTPADEFYNPCQYGPELSRDFRGLRVWLPLKIFGAQRFRAALVEKCELAAQCANALSAVPGIELCHPPQLSLFAFVLNRGRGLEQQNQDTKRLVEKVCAKGRVMVTGATVGNVYYARVCVLCFRTRAEHIAYAIEDIMSAAG
jgi:aromatic-L-amino-acid decarboxylase